MLWKTVYGSTQSEIFHRDWKWIPSLQPAEFAASMLLRSLIFMPQHCLTAPALTGVPASQTIKLQLSPTALELTGLFEHSLCPLTSVDRHLFYSICGSTGKKAWTCIVLCCYSDCAGPDKEDCYFLYRFFLGGVWVMWTTILKTKLLL